MSNETQDDLLTAEELSTALKLPLFTIKELSRKRAIPRVEIGHRTHRFIERECRAALLRKTIKAK